MKTSEVIPFNFENHVIRSVEVCDQPWFVAQDVCEALQLQNPSQSVSKLDDDERSMLNIGRQGEAIIISESGLYFLTIRCRDAVKPGTLPHRFRKWVTNEVLPQIRKCGSYQHSMPAYPIDGRLLLTVKDGCLVSSRVLPSNQHVMTIEEFLELAGRAGYIVIHEDDLKALAAGKKCSFPAR
ncbi:BRO-N domain-containing protein [Pantoea coffeiphila]|uniref:Bro-N domain-containing protein n=1 Tax=Pantoea coffeiphila TaxID=1465635 RepID=A0A2S9I838_9GAMM|nr:BRO family protein [Pantoea coffeiphila]PRD13960.1 hypothetical protein CQW29_18305 [Pantoea coffeiphila]